MNTDITDQKKAADAADKRRPEQTPSLRRKDGSTPYFKWFDPRLSAASAAFFLIRDISVYLWPLYVLAVTVHFLQQPSRGII